MYICMNQGVQGKCITNKATPTRTTLFQRKKELPWVGLEPTTLRFPSRALFLLSFQGCSVCTCTLPLVQDTQALINPWRACARVTVVVLCVCLSVTALAATVSIYTCNQRHPWVSLRLLKVWNFEKTFRSRVMA